MGAHGGGAARCDPRARHVHCEPGATDDVHAAWTAELGAGWEVLRRDEVVAAGLLGPRLTTRTAGLLLPIPGPLTEG